MSNIRSTKPRGSSITTKFPGESSHLTGPPVNGFSKVSQVE